MVSITNSTGFSPNFKTLPNGTNKKNMTHGPIKRPNLLDTFETDVKNSADLNDIIQVPRTIFKGYLAFMAGTALTTIAAVAKNKHPKVSDLMNILSTGLIIYGTFSFVRPYIIKD